MLLIEAPTAVDNLRLPTLRGRSTTTKKENLPPIAESFDGAMAAKADQSAPPYA